MRKIPGMEAKAGPKGKPGELRARVKHLVTAGVSPRTIAIELGISTSAVYQHIASLRKAGELPQPEERAS